MAKIKSGDKNRIASFWVLFATISAASMAYVGSTALNISLAAIQSELGARGADLLWISNSYALVQASLIIVSGSLCDHYGRIRICLIGILLFAIASLVCGLATSTEVLIIARFAQGIGSAMIIPSSLAIVSAYFDGGNRGWAIGIWSAFTLLTSGLGPILGGALTEVGLWRFVFFIHIPFGFVAALILILYVPESYNRGASKKINVIGAIMVTLGLGGITYGFIESAQYGFTSPQIFLPIITGIALLVRFVWGEQRSDHSIMPLRLFKSRTFTGANIVTLLLYGALGPANIYLPLNMIQIQGYSEIFVGLSLLPMTISLVVCSSFIGGVVDRHGPRKPLIIGQLLAFVGFVLLALVGVTSGQDAYFSTFFLPILLFGIGLGISLAPLLAAVMGSIPQRHAGIASGINQTLTRSSQVLTLAILGGLAISMFSQTLLNAPVIKALPAPAQSQLAADAGHLAETSIPDTLSEAEQEIVRQEIRQSFAATFSALMWMGAALCFASVLLTYFLIDNKLLLPKDEEIDLALYSA